MRPRFKSIEDFVADESFQEFCLGSKAESVHRWKRYVKNNPSQSEEIEEARQMVLMLSGSALYQSSSKKVRHGRKISQLALIFIAFITLGAVVLLLEYKGPSEKWNTITVSNDYETILLPDDSKIECRKGVELKIHKRFLKKRVVEIDGEAFFSVAKNNRAPQFKVITKQGEIDVLGTQFLVRTQMDNLKVLLTEGGIKFTDRQNDYRLYPGDLLISNLQSTSIEHGVDSESHALWRSDKITFKQKPLIEILEALERSYDLHIALESKDLEQRKITASVTKNDPMLLLQAISSIYDIQINRENDLIILK